jgi:hypothetical protein
MSWLKLLNNDGLVRHEDDEKESKYKEQDKIFIIKRLEVQGAED